MNSLQNTTVETAEEYSDEEDLLDTLLSVVTVLDAVLQRRLPRALERDTRLALERVATLVSIKEDWLH